MATEIIVPLGMFAMVAFIVWISSVTSRRAHDRRAELLKQVIDKFSSGEAFAETLRTPEGRQLVEALSIGKKEQSDSVGLFTGGAILTCLGIGFQVLTMSDLTYFRIPAVVVLAVGVGLLVSAEVARRAERKREQELKRAIGSRSSGDGNGPDLNKTIG